MREPTAPARHPRAWRILATLLAASLVAAACGGDDTDSADPGEGITDTTLTSDTDEVVPGGTLEVGLEAEATSWLPGEGVFASAQTNVARAIYDSIAAHGADGEIYPLLAETIEANDDATEWTITLREGIEFHDGTPLDAAAIKENFETYLTRDTSNLSASLAQVTELRVDGPLTYTYVLATGNVAFPDVLTGAIGWPFSNQACAEAAEECGSNPVGAGPFEMESWQRDAQTVLVRNENYWRTDEAGNQLPYLDSLIFRPITDEDSRFNSVLAGDIHVGQTLRQSIVRRAMEEADAGTMQSLTAIGNSGGGAIFNTMRAPVDDVRVRLGLAHALVQEDLIEILGGTGITPPQTQYFSPDSPWFSAAVEEAWPKYDPELAQQLLDEYTNDPDRSDGKDVGAPISIEFNCPPDPSLLEVSQGYQAMWDAMGVEVRLNSVEQPVHINNAIGADSNPPLSGNYMANCWRMGANEDPYTTLRPAFSDPAVEALNFTNYTSPSVQENLETMRTAQSFEDRYDAVEAIMMEFTEQVPNTWTGGTATALYALPEVRNLGGWTVPGGHQGDGAMEAQVYWAEVWLEQ
ncbi:MAG: hypothetical protein JJE52_09580 [Acidimicrobiia bacterium]|nr:hypothetical protein [Acidimicrobiia bacterium]